MKHGTLRLVVINARAQKYEVWAKVSELLPPRLVASYLNTNARPLHADEVEQLRISDEPLLAA
jgi:hypothetical protein